MCRISKPGPKQNCHSLVAAVKFCNFFDVEIGRTLDKSDQVAPHPVLASYYNSKGERRQKVDSMFNASAVHYDWITNVMSFGSGQWYRRQALFRAGITSDSHILDIGAGTGVISLLGQEIVGENGSVTALDPSPGMLGVAAANGVQRPVLGLGEKLPFPDNQFDFITMGYALRHVEDLNLLFSEYQRVLKPGGKILLLEITRPGSAVGTFFLKLYLKGFVPLITRLFRRSRDAQTLMEYYWETIDQCVRPQTILNSLSAQKLDRVKRHVVMGIFSEYSGVKPK